MPRLSDYDIRRLDDYFEAHSESAGGLPDTEALDGYLSAVVAAPVPIMPSDWMGFVWGHGHRFADEATARDMIERLMRAYDAVVERVRDPAAADEPTEELMPLVAIPEPDPDDSDALPDMDDTSLPVGALWSWGFQLGRSLRAADWDRRVDDWEGLDEDLLDIDELMLGLADDESTSDVDDDLPTLGERLSVIASIPSLLHDLYLDAQQQAAGPVEPFRRESPKVGRNEPCPCGSGRKYKHCHGGN